MRLDELSDEQLDRQLRKLLPAAPSSRSWQRIEREELIRHITTGDHITEAGHDHAGAEGLGRLVEVAPHSTERPRRWPTLLAASAAVIVVVGGLVIAERSADAPGSTQEPQTSPATTGGVSEASAPPLPAGPMEPDRFGVVTDAWAVAGPATGDWGMWLGWESSAAEALVARPDGDMLRDGVTLTVSATHSPDHYIGNPRQETVAGLDVEVYAEPGTPALTTVVLPGSPAVAVSGFDPVAFLEAAGGFPVEGARDGDGGVRFAVGALPDGYELIVPPTQRAPRHLDAWTRASDGDGGDGIALRVGVRDPRFGWAPVGDLQRIDINGADAWRTGDGAVPTVFWQVSDTTYAAVVGASSIDDAITFARAVDFVDQATWTKRYDVAPRPDPPDPGETPTASTTPAPEQNDGRETVDDSAQSPEMAQSGLVLPSASVEPSYAQHNPGALQRTRAVLEAPNGRVVAVTLDFNSFGELAAEWDQREIGGVTWAGVPQGGGFTYVAADECRLLVVNAGGTEPSGWDTAIEPLLAAIDLNEQTTITLPNGWHLIGVGAAGDEYVVEFDLDLPGISPVLLTQSLNSNAESLMASAPGVGVRDVVVDGRAGWQTTEPDPSGRYYTAWNGAVGGLMIGTKENLAPPEVERVLNELTLTATSEWDARYQDIDVGRNITRVEPTCDTGGMTVM